MQEDYKLFIQHYEKHAPNRISDEYLVGIAVEIIVAGLRGRATDRPIVLKAPSYKALLE